MVGKLDQAHVARSAQQRRRLKLGPSVVPAAVCVLLLTLPLLGLLIRSLTAGGLASALQRPIVIDALKLSAITTTIVLVGVLVLGSPLALILARHRGRFSVLIDSIVDLPIVLPPAVAGLALLLTFGRRGVFGPTLSALGIELPFTSAAVVLASFFVAAPFFVRAARSGFLAVPRELEEAARVEGATEREVFRFVTAPVALPSLFGGAVLAWARALGEFGATIMFAGQIQGRTQTMPLAIYAALESDTDAALGLSVILLVTSATLLIAFRRWLQTTADGV